MLRHLAIILNDGTLGGSLEEVLLDLDKVQRAAGELGLQLNCEKSEMICEDTTTRNAMLRAVPGICETDRDQATMLGSPVGNVSSIQKVIQAKSRSLEVLGSRLQYLHSHDAFCLFSHALAIPKVLYTLRSSACGICPRST